MSNMLVVESKGVHRRADCRQVLSELDELYRMVSNRSYSLVASPEIRETGEPEAVEMPLNSSARESAEPKLAQLPEHAGRTLRLHGTHLMAGSASRPRQRSSPS